ncbi:hypothetical protein [Streptomyces sp. H27-D2]|uniref:hypothetical protein n=1 Tax=Streptomyces sp. H27-D2 TaxID=3046304 RepID=UPI002DBE4983|nr:hypothetical protein [Streptomyces sp. H27-D2]MEC4015702.1 hypothetical protein [Streptomyces sp. H27-D2]
MRVPGTRGSTVQDHVALAEIELCADLMIAASTANEERLSSDRIDEVIRGGADSIAPDRTADSRS